MVKQQITLEASSEAVDFLSEVGYEPQYGARPIKRAIQELVLNALSKALLRAKLAQMMSYYWTPLKTNLRLEMWNYP